MQHISENLPADINGLHKSVLEKETKEFRYISLTIERDYPQISEISDDFTNIIISTNQKVNTIMQDISPLLPISTQEVQQIINNRSFIKDLFLKILQLFGKKDNTHDNTIQNIDSNIIIQNVLPQLTYLSTLWLRFDEEYRKTQQNSHNPHLQPNDENPHHH